MKNTESINFKVGINNSQDGNKKRLRRRSESPTLSGVISFIEGLAVGRASKDMLISVAKKMPNGSLENFKANYRKYLGRKG